MLKSDIVALFYERGYRSEFEGIHYYQGNSYRHIAFYNSMNDKFVDCVYLSENEILIGCVRYRNSTLDDASSDRLKKIESSIPNINDFLDSVESGVDDISVGDTDILAEIKARNGQQIYRNKLMELWEGKCSLTGIDVPDLLVGSHAKAWKYSSDSERLNEYNGFLFEARIDKLFDKYLISFNNDGKILISNKLNEQQRDKLGLSLNMHLRWISNRHLPFLEFHRNIFMENQL